MDSEKVGSPNPARPYSATCAYPSCTDFWLLFLYIQRAETMHSLDIGYQTATHKTEILVKDEEARRLKLRSQLLRNDNATIKEDLARKEERIKELLAQHEALQKQLHRTSEKARQQENRTRSLERELANVKVHYPPPLGLAKKLCCYLRILHQ